MSKRALVLMCSIFLVVPLLFMGCSGDDGSAGAPGAPGVPGAPGDNAAAIAKPETCAVCHKGAGDDHQEYYDALYQGGVIKVTGLAYNFGANSDNVTFTVKKAGVPVDCTKLTNLNIYFTPYDNTGRFQFNPAAERLSIKGAADDNTATGDFVGNATTGLCSSTKPSQDNVALASGVIVVYGYDGLVGLLPPSRVRQVNYPYAALLKIGTVDYLSAANVSGCEKCHTIPYLKHGNILGAVDNAANDFITCKACHLDNGEGGHQFWQELVDNPEMAAREWNGKLTAADNTYIKANYGYQTRLMNDVHMSHAMEFEYPQSMANCATCHAGKLDVVLTDNNFTAETCKSCHPVTGSAQAEKPQPALKAIWAEKGVSAFHTPVPSTCNSSTACHNATGAGKAFNEIHTGYDKVIYGTDNGVKYSDIIKVTIDNASFDNTNKLTISFSSTGTLGGLVTPNITPTVLVGLYGYDTKDYIVGPHERSIDTNRDLEYAVGATHPRFTTDNTTPGGSWKVTADLSTWAGMISAGSVKRVEIGVMPRLQNADNVVVALNAPSKTFDLKTKKFVSFYPAIVKVATGCNNCHDALATTFHSADRGGNIVVCRLCHITKSGGSHLEMQSRSIDSYAHAIHTFQNFDIGDIDFDNNVESMFHDLKIETTYPTFGTTNCVSCHNAGTFNVPDQAKSLAGILSGSDTVAGRALNGVPAYVTGPASRACGACHRAELIKEDAAGEFASFNQHTQDGGYLLVPGDIPTLIGAINAVMPMFNDDVIVVLP